MNDIDFDARVTCRLGLIMKMKLRITALLLVVIMVISACSGDGTVKVKLDPKNPVTITIWHYYNGSQQVAFDEMINVFNTTVGKEAGIFVQGKGQGDVTGLEEAVMASLNQQVGSDEVPNIFSSYADTAYAIDQQGHLADISKYLSEEELGVYVDSYIEEGRIGENGELRIFPTAKSSEIFMLNKTDWDKFSNATGADLSLLQTKEGLVEAAKAYYEWTDSLTPDITGDGKSFYGRDGMANLFIIGSMQMGTELFEVNNRQVTLNIDKEVIKKIWDFYYVSYIKGYFQAYGRFRSDDLKINEIIAFTGSTTSSMYFPDVVDVEGDTYPIEYMVFSEPPFANSDNYIVQQGAGMVVTKGTPEEEYASIMFLKWFTQMENNLEFSVTSSYLPVQKEAYSMEVLDQIITDNQIDISPKTYDTFQIIFENFDAYILYTNKAFEGGSKARKVLDYHLSDKATADREKILQKLDTGMSLDEAVEEFISEEAFEKWFGDFSNALQESVQ